MSDEATPDPTPPNPWRVYEIGEADTIIAAGIDDAWTVWSEHTGERRQDYEGQIEELPMDAEIGIWCDTEGQPAEPGGDNRLIKLSAAEWIDRVGRGFLCSSEY